MAYRYQQSPSGAPPIVSFESPMDFVDYIDAIESGRIPGVDLDPQSRQQADEIRRNPNDWEVYQGHVRQKQNMKFKDFIPAMAIGGAMFGGPALAGLFGGGGGGAGGAAGAAAAGGGALPTSAAMTNLGIKAGMGLGLPSVASAAGKGAVGALAGKAGGSLLSRVLTGLKDYAPLIPAGIAATRGLTQGRTPAENQLGNVLGIAERRINQAQPLYDELMALGADDAALTRSRRQQADPLFQALMTMANSGLPDYAKRG